MIDFLPQVKITFHLQKGHFFWEKFIESSDILCWFYEKIARVEPIEVSERKENKKKIWMIFLKLKLTFCFVRNQANSSCFVQSCESSRIY